MKVYDTVGLAAPLAAHTDRMEDGRIGHEFLPYDWVLAETGVVEDPVNFPRWIDVNWVNQAEVALQCPATGAHRVVFRPLDSGTPLVKPGECILIRRVPMNRIPA